MQPWRAYLTQRSKGDHLGWFWKLFFLAQAARPGLVRDVLTYLANRSAHRHGGYVGPDAVILGIPSLPHGLHGVFISRYATLGPGCRIYQHVTIGEIDAKAPVIGENCWIGAGAILVGGIRIGRNVKIGAGAIVHQDIPDCATVVSQPPRILQRRCEGRDDCPTAEPGLAGD